MNGKITVALVLALTAVAAAGYLFFAKSRTHTPLSVTLRISVTPPEQSGFVAEQARSTKFKYIMGKESGLKPAFAQKLAVKDTPNSPIVEAQVGVETKEEAKKYADAFVPALQMLCGKDVQLALTEQKVE